MLSTENRPPTQNRSQVISSESEDILAPIYFKSKRQCVDDSDQDEEYTVVPNNIIALDPT